MLFVAIDAFESSACGMKKVPLLFGKTEKNLPYLLHLLQIGLNLNMENMIPNMGFGLVVVRINKRFGYLSSINMVPFVSCLLLQL